LKHLSPEIVIVGGGVGQRSHQSMTPKKTLLRSEP
jgi:hypothetical protein